MRSPKKGREPIRLSDLAPAIVCIQCEQEKPAAGARRFHSWHVCRDCSQKLAELPSAPASMTLPVH
ncbi:Uncharacterised protein [Delftia tsuruhatensis]|nr:Uncharacterised protein [Delftia tsuruhatensis]CAC9685338.1 Uncharacterised protein [Delftia tsuruhatensis]